MQRMISFADSIKSQGNDIAQKIVNASPEKAPLVAVVLNTLGVRLVHHVFKKQDPRTPKFNALHDVGHRFVQDLADVANQQIMSPWAPSAKSADAADKPTQQEKDVSVFADRLTQLSTKGVAPGKELVCSIKGKMRIKTVNADKCMCCNTLVIADSRMCMDH